MLDELNDRIEQAMSSAVGSLSLADLQSIAEEHAPVNGTAMYYI